MLRQRMGAFQQQTRKQLVAHYNSTSTINGFPKTSVTQNLAARYQQYLDEKTPQLRNEAVAYSNLNKVAIVGAGMSGLYSALLLKQHLPHLHVTIFEATNRIGGRVYTHWFEHERNQYFEAGAMRLPVVKWQQPVFDLIEKLNESVPEEFQINLIPYNYSCPSGNRVFVNGTKQRNGKIMTVDYANQHLDELGFPPAAEANEEAGKLLQNAIQPVANELLDNFETALEKYDWMTLHYYLSKIHCWSPEKINFVEVMSSQTNEFYLGLVDQTLLNSDFTGEVVKKWKTIEDGMCRLPKAMAKVIGEENLILNTPVQSLTDLHDGRVVVGYPFSDNEVKHDKFDAVILALPPSSIRMIPNKPTWPVALEHGLRSIHFQPLYKMGLRFKSRFWEDESLRPSNGGQSITDLPCRWVVYPSYGIGDKGKGVLLLYSWMTDFNHWLPKTHLEKVNLALNNLQKLYPEVDIYDLYAGGTPGSENYLKEAFPVQWAVEWPLGDATFYPSQFSNLYPTMKQPQKQIYFTGEHLSVYHTWIVGALDSARNTVRQILGSDIPYF